jgi:DNA processing protein
MPTEISAKILPPKIDEEKSFEESKQNELQPAGLNEKEKKIWSILKADEEIHIDDLLEKSKLSFGELNNVLVSLDLKDLVRVLPGNKYSKKL